jgi:nicotinate-nucleotide pyrophosphorylase (carboxylating)
MVVTHELDLDRIALAALAEDVGRGDVTTEATVDENATCTGRLHLKEAGVVCGLPAVESVFRTLDPDVSYEASAADGDRFSELTELARISGRTRAVLTGERTALNILGRLSGIATLTSRFVDAIEGTGAEILDTRKTTPGLRALEKYAVRCGGGRNHRFGLDDGVLVKDNHLRAAGGVRPAVDRLRASGTVLPIEVEAETLDDVREALAAGVEQVLLDNMPPALMREAVELVGGRATLEASGGVSLDTVREIAETGVDFVSVGALTHSARSLDVSLELE